MSHLYYVISPDHTIRGTDDHMDPDVMAQWKQPERRRVAKDTVGDAEVSTVFLAIDHAWMGGPPVLFETMVFGGPHEDAQWRYSTWDEAVAGHARVVDALRHGKDPAETT